MVKYKLSWEEIQVWESEVEAENQADARSKVLNDEVQEVAEVTRTYLIKRIRAWRE